MKTKQTKKYQYENIVIPAVNLSILNLFLEPASHGNEKLQFFWK